MFRNCYPLIAAVAVLVVAAHAQVPPAGGAPPPQAPGPGMMQPQPQGPHPGAMQGMQGMHGQGQMPGMQQKPMQGQGAMQGQAPGAMQGMHGQGQMPGMQPKPMQGQGPMQGQAPGAMQGGPPRNPVADDFFPPELVMQNQAVLGLKEEQASAIKTEMQKVMAHFTDLQWQQSAEEEKMATLTKQERIDEKQAVAQLDKLMGIENEIKRARIALLVRIKNTLTTDQQTKLRELGKQPGPRGPMPGGHGGANAPQPPPEGAPQPNL